ncbi:TcaA 3rd/4th domain-containing protein [Priestia koreensis]|uniref:TcaA 3rd/4th domain-containing protein n=1 Tax=Priestia koreensis TaxID=284581 RepID=UPI003D0351DC
MAYCKSCGKESKGNKSFCTHCGGAIEQKATSNDSESSVVKTRQSIKTGTKVVVASCVVLLGLGFGGYKYVEAKNSPDKIADKFISAVNKNDAQQVMALLNNSQDSHNISDQEAKSFIKYLKNNPDIWAETSKHLREEAQNYADGADVSTGDKDLVSLTSLDKKWLLFNQYGINTRSVYIKATSNESQTALYIDGKKVKTLKKDKEQTFGPYLPSDHVVKGVYKGEYTDVTDTQDLSMDDVEEDNLVANLDVTGTRIMVSSNEDDAVLYINGKSTGKKMKSVDKLGPVPTDGSMELQAVLLNGKKTDKSEVFTVEDDEDPYLYIESAEEELDPALTTSAVENNSEGTSGNNSMDGDATDEYLVIQYAVEQHYSYISDGNYSAAYELFSSDRQGKVKYESWAAGLKNTIKDDATVINVNQIDDSHASVTFSMISYDAQTDGSTLVQTWSGTWYLVKEGYDWKLNDYDIKKQGAHKE